MQEKSEGEKKCYEVIENMSWLKTWKTSQTYYIGLDTIDKREEIYITNIWSV